MNDGHERNVFKVVGKLLYSKLLTIWSESIVISKKSEDLVIDNSCFNLIPVTE